MSRKAVRIVSHWFSQSDPFDPSDLSDRANRSRFCDTRQYVDTCKIGEMDVMYGE